MGQHDDGPDRQHRRPDGVTDETVAALGKLSEALETVERARGHLYSLHQLIGHADLMLDDAVAQLRAAGHEDLAERVRTELLGRNVIAGRWTFQIVEDFDDNYYAVFRELDRAARDQLVDGRRHLYEAEMKERRRTRGRPGHEARPAEPGSSRD
ncbi:hypothetical protein ACFT9M_24830 [Micromonospora purpureochromogenes]|uniref:hypothetical protein n=1 Tax=Micromonospora purpureochromogenes TaxID=47872 RepID=UPI00363A2FF0